MQKAMVRGQYSNTWWIRISKTEKKKCALRLKNKVSKRKTKNKCIIKHIIMQMQHSKHKEKILKTSREKKNTSHKRLSIQGENTVH